MKRQDCSPQEEWVLQQLERRELADLKSKFGEEEEPRRLGAAFLVALLTDDIQGCRPHRQGIRIAQQIVAEPLALENVELPLIAGFVHFTFKKDVNLRDGRPAVNGSQRLYLTHGQKES